MPDAKKAPAGKKTSKSASETRASKKSPLPKKQSISYSGTQTKKGVFPVVGVGFSEGGLEAIEKFFSSLGSDSGMAFVLIQHISAEKEGVMIEPIKEFTEMQVMLIEDRMEIRPNRVYLAPPDRNTAVLHGKLHLMPPPSQKGRRLSIDFFFHSLAKDRAEKAICIILSGNGTDGTLGLKSVKEAGGIAMVQHPESARYRAMPESAIATGLVDYILPVEKMPGELIKYVSHPFFSREDKAEFLPAKSEDYLDKIFLLLREQTGHDFSYYKENTICRRIKRRMAVHNLDQIGSYLT